MSFESMIAAAQRLSISVEALAALGAQLRLQQDLVEGNPRVRALLNEIARAVDPQLLEDVDEHQRAITLALIQTMFRQALDLLENPGRELGWSHNDARGQNSPNMRARTWSFRGRSRPLLM
jgi:hypothetical protein